jgi:hypothetical protein
MARRIVVGVEQDERGRIIALYGDEDAAWSPVSAREARRGISSGVHTYVAVGSIGAADVHVLGGQWLRTNHNLIQDDNLDFLGQSGMGRYGAGTYGIAAILSPHGVSVLARELHASGAINNRFSLLADGLLVTGVLGVPRFEPGAEPAHFGIVRDAVCHIRNAADAADPGVSAVATVTAECDVTITTDARAGWIGFTLAYSVPASGAVRVETAVADPAREAVIAALTEWVASSRTDRWDLPVDGMLAGVKRVDAGFAPSGHAHVGFRFDGKREGLFPDATPGYDWTIALARPYVVERIGEAVRVAMGGLPAPLGEDRRVAVPGTADVHLTALDAGLMPGAVQLTGVAVSTAGVTVTARFTATFTLSLDSDGLVTATLGGTHIDLVEWYAQLADFVAGGAIVSGVEEGLRRALGALGADAASGLLSADLLTRIVAAGTENVASVRAVPRRVWIEPGALRLGGDFERSPVAPQVTAVALGGRVDLTMSSTPGATLHEVRWEARGETETQEFEQRALSWTPPSGASSVTVTVTTDEGETASATVSL